MKAWKWGVAIIVFAVLVLFFTPVFWIIEMKDLIERTKQKIDEATPNKEKK